VVELLALFTKLWPQTPLPPEIPQARTQASRMPHRDRLPHRLPGFTLKTVSPQKTRGKAPVATPLTVIRNWRSPLPIHPFYWVLRPMQYSSSRLGRKMAAVAPLFPMRKKHGFFLSTRVFIAFRFVCIPRSAALTFLWL
jgi:hypothetical protein